MPLFSEEPRPPTAAEVQAQQAKFRGERDLLVKTGTAKRFVPILLEKADDFARRAGAALTAGRLGQAADLFHQARWQLPYQSPQVPDHVSRILGSMRLRHSDEINDVAFSPDGKRLATAAKDRLVKIWDMDNGHELLTYTGHADVRSLAYNPDGKFIASAGDDADIRVWDPVTGKDVRIIKGKATYVTSLVFSRDGKYIFAASDDKAVRIYETQTGMLKREITDFGLIVHKLAFSPDGRIMAAGVGNGQIRLWEYPKMIDNLTQPEYWAKQDFAGASHDVTFSPDGRTMARVGPDGVKLYNTPTPDATILVNAHRLLIQPPEPSNPFRCAIFSKDGKTLFTGGKDGVIRMWDPETGQPTGTFKGHSGEIRALVFNPAGTVLASASGDFTVRLWPFDMVLQSRDFKGHDGPVWTASFSPDGQRLVSASGDKTARVWDAASGNVLFSLEHAGAVTVALFSPDGKGVLTGGADKLLHLWDAGSGKPLQTYAAHEGTVTAADFHPAGRQFASGGSDRRIYIWTAPVAQTSSLVPDPKPSRIIETPSMIAALVYSPDGKLLASGHIDQTIRIWDPASGKELQSWRGHAVAVSGLAFSPNGQWLASAGADNLVKVWPRMGRGRIDNPSYKGGREEGAGKVGRIENPSYGTTPIILDGHHGPLTSVAFRKDSLHLVSCGSDQLVKLWKLEAGVGKEMQTFRSHADWVTSVAFSRDGYFVASASVDRTVKVWEITSRDIPLTAEHTGAVLTATFSADGTLIASGGTDRTIKIWDSGTGLEKITLTGHTEQVLSVAFLPDGKTLVSSGADRTIRLWDVASGRELAKKPNFIGLINAVPYLVPTPDGKKLLAWVPGNERFMTITAYDVATGNEIFSFNDNGRHVDAVAFTPDCGRVVLKAEDGSIRIYDLTKRGQPLPGGDWFIFKKGIRLGDVAFTPDSKTLVVTTDTGEIVFCDIVSRKVIRTVKGHNRRVGVCIVSPDGKRCATADFDTVVKVWDIADGKELRSWNMRMPFQERESFYFSMAFSPDSRRLVTANPNTTLYVLDLP